MKKRVLLLLSIIGFIVSCSREDKTGNHLELEPSARPVVIVRAEMQDLCEAAAATGALEAEKDVLVSSETSGRVVQMNAIVGQWAEKGDVIVKVDDELLKLNLQAREATISAGQSALDNVRGDLERVQKLRDEGLLTDVELDKVKLQVEMAEAELKGAQVGKDLAEKQLRDATIRAPVSGFVAQTYVEVGEVLGPGRPVVNLMDTKRLRVKVGFSEKQVGMAKVADPVEVVVDLGEEKVFEGRILSVGLKQDDMTRTYPVEIVLKNQEGQLRPGMMARVSLEKVTGQRAILLPEDAVLRKYGKRIVFVVEGGVASAREVVPGERMGSRIAIREGIQPQEAIVVVGQESIADGDLVEVLNPTGEPVDIGNESSHLS